jgi:signal transduction histidine kinase
VSISLEAILQLAPKGLTNYRSDRYRADEQAVELSAFAADDAAVITSLYAFLSELAGVVGGQHDLADPAPLLAFVARHDLHELVFRLQRLGADAPQDRQLAEALHDIRGGAMSALFVQLSRLGRVPHRADMARALSIYTRDHMKMMRNVVRDLDPAARARDLSPLPHSLGDLARALREFTGVVGEEAVVVDVVCTAEGVIAESCVECSAIDRVAYNLLNNAVRYADRPAIEAWLLVLESDLRVVVANSISSAQRSVLSELFENDPEALFGSFTTSGSGHGLRILSELVGRAYGIASTETLTESGYIGAKLVDGCFVGWFHWPLSGA